LTEHFWKTSISKVEPNKILVRGYDLTQLVGRFTYAELTYLLWRGELPTPSHSKMMDALLTACLEHSLNSPSVDATVFVASSGVPLQAAVSAGVAAMGDWHGGAIEEAAKMLQECAAVKDRSLHEVVVGALTTWKDSGKRLPGYGHPTHTKDPRTTRLLEIADETKVSGRHVKLALEISALTDEVYGKHLTLNVDGCIAAIMSDMGFDWRLGKGFFIVSRTPGLVAHAYEQMYFEKPYKSPHWHEIEYTGVAEREVPGG
jgi:citryl-CoA lyase